MTSPIHTQTPYERFKTMIDELIHGKPKVPPTVKPEDEEPSWASSSRDQIQRVGEVISTNSYNR